MQNFDKLKKDLNKYYVVFAQFCHEILRGGLGTRAVLTGVKVLTAIPLLGASTMIPSGHHRYIRFQVHSRDEDPPSDPLKGKWGIIERIENGPTLTLYESEEESKREGACVTKRVPFGCPIQMTVTRKNLLGDLQQITVSTMD